MHHHLCAVIVNGPQPVCLPWHLFCALLFCPLLPARHLGGQKRRAGHGPAASSRPASSFCLCCNSRSPSPSRCWQDMAVPEPAAYREQTTTVGGREEAEHGADNTADSRQQDESWVGTTAAWPVAMLRTACRQAQARPGVEHLCGAPRCAASYLIGSCRLVGMPSSAVYAQRAVPDHAHAHQLHAHTDAGAQQQGQGRRTEHICVHQLLSALLLQLFLLLGVVAVQVPAQRAHHDHGHDIAVSSSTMARELRMDNQWIWSSPM